MPHVEPPTRATPCCEEYIYLHGIADLQDATSMSLTSAAAGGRGDEDEAIRFLILLDVLTSQAIEWDSDGYTTEILQALSTLLAGDFDADVISLAAARLDEAADLFRTAADFHEHR